MKTLGMLSTAVLTIVWLCLGLTSNVLGVVDEPPVTLQVIANHWKMRQEKTRTARFTWTERSTFTKGSLSRPVGLASKNGGIVPPSDITFDVPKTLCLDGEKLRYTFDTKAWSNQKNAWVSDRYLSVFDGETAKMLRYPGSQSWPVGVTRAENEHPDARNLNLQPLLMTYRALNPKMAVYRVEKLRILPQQAKFAGRPCILLEDKAASLDSRRTLWVDAARDYSIVRYAAEMNNKLVYQIDVEYTQHENEGWVPSSWSYTIMSPEGAISRAFDSTVNEFTINEPIDPGEFNIEYPSGTRVTDSKNPKSPEYIITRESDKRTIPPRDIGATYEQLLRTEPGHAFEYKRRNWLISAPGVFLGVVLIGTGLTIGWRIFLVMRKRSR